MTTASTPKILANLRASSGCERSTRFSMIAFSTTPSGTTSNPGTACNSAKYANANLRPSTVGSLLRLKKGATATLLSWGKGLWTTGWWLTSGKIRPQPGAPASTMPASMAAIKERRFDWRRNIGWKANAIPAPLLAKASARRYVRALVIDALKAMLERFRRRAAGAINQAIRLRVALWHAADSAW